MFKRLLRMSNAAAIPMLNSLEQKTATTQANHVEKVVIIGSGPGI